MYCKKCGAYLPDDSLVCTACGAPQQAAGPEPTEPAVPPAPGAPAGQEGVPGDPFAGRGPAPLPPVTPVTPAAQPAPSAPGPDAAPPAPNAPVYQQAAYQQPGRPTPAYSQHAFRPLPPEEPVSTGEWVWSSILAVIPLVGLVVLFVWAFGGGAKLSKRNWARALLIFWAAAIVFYVLLILIILVGVGAAGGYYY